MHAVLSPGGHPLSGASRGLELTPSARHALRWGAIVVAGLAAAASLSYGIAVFETSLATQLATGTMGHGFSQADKTDTQDPFLQQKRDAKIEELPAQF